MLHEFRNLARSRALRFALTAALLGSTGLSVPGFAAGGTQHIIVYHPIMYHQHLYLLPVAHRSQPLLPPRATSEERITATLEQLLTGDTGGLTSFIAPLFPADARILSVELDDHRCTLDFNDSISHLNVGARGEMVAVQALAHTAFVQAPEDITELYITVEGQKVESLCGHVGLLNSVKPSPNVLWPGAHRAAGHWAEIEILAASLRSVSFRVNPDAPLTRGQFIIWLERTRGPTDEKNSAISPGEIQFRDLPGDDVRLKRAAASLIEDGILRPEDYGGRLNPKGSLTRREALTMCTRLACRRRGAHIKSAAASTQSSFSGLPRWLGDVLATADKMGMIKGYPDGTLRLNRAVSKAEALVMLARAAGFAPNAGGLCHLQPLRGDQIAPGQPVMGAVAGDRERSLDYRVRGDGDEQIRGTVPLFSPPGGYSSLWYCFALDEEMLSGITPKPARVDIILTPAGEDPAGSAGIKVPLKGSGR